MRISKWIGFPALVLAAVLTVGCGPDTSTEVLEGPVDEAEMEEYGEDQEALEEEAEEGQY